VLLRTVVELAFELAAVSVVRLDEPLTGHL
jgi:hypothetical protein